MNLCLKVCLLRWKIFPKCCQLILYVFWSRLSKADFPPYFCWASFTQLKIWIEQKVWVGGNSCLTPWSGILAFSGGWAQAEALVFLGFKLIGFQTGTTHKLSRVSRLPPAELGTCLHWQWCEPIYSNKSLSRSISIWIYIEINIYLLIYISNWKVLMKQKTIKWFCGTTSYPK